MLPEAALETLCAEFAALKLRLRRLYIQWCVSGPTLEASSALAAMAQEEAGHARVLARLAGSREPSLRADELVPVEAITSWPELVGTVGPVEVVLASLLRNIEHIEDAGFARNLVKIAAEERHHAQFFLGWFTELDQNENAAGELFGRARKLSDDRIADWLLDMDATLGAVGVRGIDLRAARDLEPTEPNDIPCIHCGSLDVGLTAAFGGSLMTSLMRCNACGGQFEAVRWRQPAD